MESLQVDRKSDSERENKKKLEMMKWKTKKEMKYSCETEASKGTVDITTANREMEDEQLESGKSGS